MIILASTIACQAVAEYKVMVGAGLNVGLTPVEIKEILYQSVPYVGIAKVFDFLHAANEVLQGKGSACPWSPSQPPPPKHASQRGSPRRKTTLADTVIDRMRQQSPQDQLPIQDFLAANCFGDDYTRTGLI